MSLMTQAYLLERYGPRLGIPQLVEVLGMAERTIYNGISAKTFPVPTYIDGGRRWADYRDVATYLDECRAKAA